MLYPHFLGENPTYDDSKFVILPAPLEYTVSYGGGTKNAPYAILDASIQLETYDLETRKELVYSGIYTVDKLSFDGDISRYEEQVKDSVVHILEDKKFPIVLGGEHSITPMALAPFKNFYKDISVLHFDAHLDLRKTYEGTKYSHACAMRRVYDELDIKNISSVGIRSVSPEESNFLKTSSVKVFYAESFYSKSFSKQALLDTLGKNVYITFDVDALDPSILPSTGTPEPGGLMWYETLELLRFIISNRNIIGLDIVELAPDTVNHYSEFTTAKLLYKILNYVYYADNLL